MFELVVPAYNEENVISDTILKLDKILNKSGIDYRLTLASNGSVDGTIEQCKIQNSKSKMQVGIIDIEEKGKGRAIRVAADKSVAEMFGFIDADLSADPERIPEFVRMVAKGEADIVVGSRLLQSKTTNRGLLRTLSSRIFNLMVRMVLGVRIQDVQCGLKVMNRRAVEVLKSCKEDGWFLDMELIAKAQELGLNIVEMPVLWVEYRYPERKSKLRHWRDGWKGLVAMLRIKRSLRSSGGERKIQT